MFAERLVEDAGYRERVTKQATIGASVGPPRMKKWILCITVIATATFWTGLAWPRLELAHPYTYTLTPLCKPLGVVKVNGRDAGVIGNISLPGLLRMSNNFTSGQVYSHPPIQLPCDRPRVLFRRSPATMELKGPRCVISSSPTTRPS